ncbi:hypothetical protein V8G54_012782 [Vigna mungo]|uniref:Uncharacterized protein n=1 Tax=Vigna mungo TaxID=3915 RepID=A0AAQ3NUG2_VIGMU
MIRNLSQNVHSKDLQPFLLSLYFCGFYKHLIKNKAFYHQLVLPSSERSQRPLQAYLPCQECQPSSRSVLPLVQSHEPFSLIEISHNPNPPTLHGCKHSKPQQMLYHLA